MGGLRKVCRFVHRELGYFAVGLTLVYAISGLAVNHVHHWNPSYAQSEESFRIDPVDPETLIPDTLGPNLVTNPSARPLHPGAGSGAPPGRGGTSNSRCAPSR